MDEYAEVWVSNQFGIRLVGSTFSGAGALDDARDLARRIRDQNGGEVRWHPDGVDRWKSLSGQTMTVESLG